MATINEEIADQIELIERTRNVKVLLAVESGSRIWGFESPDSDYDVRFIYANTPQWYLGVGEKRDVIEVNVNNTPGLNPLLDISGWDIRKAFALAKKGNPPLHEWISSPIKYKWTTDSDTIAGAILERYSPRASAFHYYHMARNNYRAYLQGSAVITKKYLYVMRPLMAMLHVEKGFGFPPLDIDELRIKTIGNSSMVSVALDILVSRKKMGLELSWGPRIGVISNWIEEQLDRRDKGFGFTDLLAHKENQETTRELDCTLSGLILGQ